MQEIKFRAWDIINKEMYQWGEIFHLPAWEIFPGTPEQRAYNIMQYTGLKDKKGNEIYEGDILHADGYWNIFVEFENGSFMCKAVDKVQYVNNVIDIPMSRFHTLGLYEVIGNIHEEDFLLKQMYEGENDEK